MDSSANLGARSKEDVALDLLKFVAGTTNFVRPAAQTPGFSSSTSPKADDQVAQLLDLYKRCLSAVEGKQSSSPTNSLFAGVSHKPGCPIHDAPHAS